MARFAKRTALALFFVCVYAMTAFFVPEGLYTKWAAVGTILLIFWIVLSFRLVPSRKRETLMRGLVSEYLETRKQEAELRAKAMAVADSYWSFLEAGQCKKCGSGLWSARLPDGDESYAALLKKKESLVAFQQKLTPSLSRKVKSLAIYRET